MPVAVITGASRGIGLAIAKYLAADYDLVLIARNQTALQQLVNDIQINQPKNRKAPIYFALDVTDEQKVLHAAKQVIKQLGQIDVLITSAGIYQFGTLDVPVEQIKHTININLIGTINVINAFIPFMKEKQNGYIICIASRSGIEARKYGGVYACSKFALVGFCESLYKELLPYGIKVTVLCPAYVQTTMAVIKSLAFEDLIKTDDIVNSVNYLLTLSKNASIKKLVIDCSADIIQSQQTTFSKS